MFLLASALAGAPPALAQQGGAREPALEAEIQRSQQDRRERAEQNATARPSELSPTQAAPARVDLAALPRDNPCFPVHELDLRDNPFGWLAPLLQPVAGQCLGKRAIEALQNAANNALIARGYVTSRVLIPPQNLASGKLVLNVLAGRVSEVRHDPGSGPSVGWARMVLPSYPGALYNQHDIDQAIESVRRLAGQGDTSFDILPGAQPGASVLLVKPAAGYTAKRWHATLGADNYGLDATGRYELTGTFTYDSPLHLYDQLTLSGSTNADFESHREESNSIGINWNVPLGRASVFVSASRSRYLQTIAGFEEPVTYGGNSAELSAGASYVPYRSSSARSSAQLRFYHRYNHANYDDQPLAVQARDLIGLEATLGHQQYVGNTVLAAGVGWRQTLLGATKNPGMVFDNPDWNGKTQILSANAQAVMPFVLGTQALRYAAQFNLQHAYTPVIPTDYFTIGTPFTVRGFDGQITLAAESGWAWRNELGWPLGGQLPFIALDVGRINGASAQFLPGTLLVGTALGLRGQLPATRYAAIDYEVTLGWPLTKPPGIQTGMPSLLFQATTRF